MSERYKKECMEWDAEQARKQKREEQERREESRPIGIKRVERYDEDEAHWEDLLRSKMLQSCEPSTKMVQ